MPRLTFYQGVETTPLRKGVSLLKGVCLDQDNGSWTPPGLLQQRCLNFPVHSSPGSRQLLRQTWTGKQHSRQSETRVMWLLRSLRIKMGYSTMRTAMLSPAMLDSDLRSWGTTMTRGSQDILGSSRHWNA